MSDGQEQLDRGRCREKICNAEIMWAKRESSGKPVPLDPIPDDNKGNMILVEGPGVKPLARQLTGYLLIEPVRQPRYTTHFTTCPAADRFRKRKQKEESK